MLILLPIYLGSVLISALFLAHEVRMRKLLNSSGVDNANGLMIFFPFINVIYFIFNLAHNSDSDELKREFRLANALYKCSSCRRLSRRYQRELVKLECRVNGIKNRNNCPHCDVEYSLIHSKIHTERRWQEYHPDCPKLSEHGFVKYLRTKREIEEIVSEMESFEELERYTKGGNGI